MQERNTPQKKIIMDYLKSVTCHPTAEEVYVEVKKEMPNISKGTVYRLLKNFTLKSDVQEINSKISHFDADTSPHGHFICEVCDKVFDACLGPPSLKLRRDDVTYLNNFNKEIGIVNSYNIYVRGICKKCNK